MKTKDARFGVFLYVIQLVTVVLDPEVPSFYTKDYVGAGISISS